MSIYARIMGTQEPRIAVHTRRLKALELENVLILVEVGAAPYTTVAAINARLGVP